MEKRNIKISLTTLIIIIVLIALCVIGITVFVVKHKNELANIIETNTIVATELEIKTQPEDEEPNIKQTTGVTVVPTMKDTITADSSWCGTFQLVWNDMKNEVVKQDIVFTPQEEMVENLNKEEFTQNMLSDNYYFKIFGLKSLALKEQIEKGIKEKFNQTSDVLDDIDWTEDALDNPNNQDERRYLFYTMLYREFEFLKEFDNLENGIFGNKYKDIEYFGIDNNTKDEIGNQIEVLYYNSQDDFAVLINTKTNDEVIFCKNPRGTNFNEIYNNINNNAKKYEGSKYFEDIDEFKAPKLKLNEKREYNELENKPFETADPIYRRGEIAKAIQTVQFSLDEKGGKIKSEAVIDMKITNMSVEKIEKKPRYFYVDDTFAIFLREKGKDKPYFAGRIEDITKFQ